MVRVIVYFKSHSKQVFQGQLGHQCPVCKEEMTEKGQCFLIPNKSHILLLSLFLRTNYWFSLLLRTNDMAPTHLKGI